MCSSKKVWSSQSDGQTFFVNKKTGTKPEGFEAG